MKQVLALACLALASLMPATGHAQALGTGSPYDQDVRVHYYERLRKSPAKALAYEAVLPGAGSVYVGFWGNAIASFAVSALGAGLWTAGAVRDDERLWWIGAGTFAAGRTYGLVSAPVGAALLNAAFRRQLGITVHY